MVDKFDSSADTPYLTKDAKAVGAGGPDVIEVVDVGEEIQLGDQLEEANVEINLFCLFSDCRQRWFCHCW